MENKKKRQRPEDFIGWKSDDGKLEVIEIYQESINGKPALFKVTCTECSKDPELFPDGFTETTNTSNLTVLDSLIVEALSGLTVLGL